MIKDALRSTVAGTFAVLPFRRSIAHALRPLHLPKSVWIHLAFTGEFRVRVGERSFLMQHHGLGAENSLFWRGLDAGFGEAWPVRVWIELCASARTVLDVGANLGIYSLVTKAVNPAARLYGFEPVAHICRKFEENVALNGFDVRCVHAAASNVGGEADIHYVEGGLTTASLRATRARTERERIETVRLDTFLRRECVSSVDLMKIDVEGFEPEVLEGMGDLLRATRPTILVEILSAEAGRRIEELVDGCDYRFFNVDETRGPIAVTRLDPEGRTRHSRNFLLCVPEVARAIGLSDMTSERRMRAVSA